MCEIQDHKDNDNLYWYEVVVVSSLLKCLKNETAFLRNKRLVRSLRETKMENRYAVEVWAGAI